MRWVGRTRGEDWREGSPGRRTSQELRHAEASFTRAPELFLNGAWKGCWWSCGRAGLGDVAFRCGSCYPSPGGRIPDASLGICSDMVERRGWLGMAPGPRCYVGHEGDRVPLPASEHSGYED